MLSRTMHDIRHDPVNDELFVNNPFAGALLVFRGGANGEEEPIRIIQGPSTLLSEGRNDRLDVDTVNNEIFVPGGNMIRVFPRDAEGDVAPIRLIKGPDTQLRGVEAVAVDNVNNVMAVGTSGASRPPEDRYGDLSYPIPPKGSILFFNRTDDGNIKPKAVIEGPNTGIVRILQLQMYTPKGWIVATQPGRVDVEEPPGVYVGVWSIHDSGDVPPRWKLAGHETQLKKPRGVVLDPKNKEMIIADMRANAVFTFYFPEIF